MTSVALISDSHGNALGLRAALDDIAARGVDRIVALGDMVEGGPHPAECLELLRRHRCEVVLGNSDAFLVDPASAAGTETARHVEEREWTLAQLAPGDLDYMRTFTPTVAVEANGRTLLCFHGTPASNVEVVMPDSPPDRLAAPGADVLAGGHLHVPQLRRVGDSVYVNPGSVGLGYDHHQPQESFMVDPWASYAIVELEPFAVHFHRVAFDAEAVTRAARERDLSGGEGVWGRFRSA